MGLSDDIIADYDAVVKQRQPATWQRILFMFARSINFRVVVFFRLGHWARSRRHKFLAYWLESRILRTGAEVSLEAEIGGGLYLAHLAGVVVGSRTRIGRNAYLLQGVTLGGSRGKEKDGRTQPVIGDNVLISAGAKILGPVRIGNNVEIGANAVVLDDLPDDSVAVGVPARVIRVGGRRVPLLESPGEHVAILRDLIRRLESIECHQGERKG